MIAGIIQQTSPHECIQSGLLAAMCSTQSYLTVPATIATLHHLDYNAVCQPHQVMLWPHLKGQYRHDQQGMESEC